MLLYLPLFLILIFGDGMSLDFSQHSLYEWLDFEGIINHEFDIVWNSKIPLKIKIFMWLLKEKKCLSKTNYLKEDGKEILLVFLWLF
jgi:zinc-binding in reverse transcriptase